MLQKDNKKDSLGTRNDGQEKHRLGEVKEESRSTVLDEA